MSSLVLLRLIGSEAYKVEQSPRQQKIFLLAFLITRRTLLAFLTARRRSLLRLEHGHRAVDRCKRTLGCSEE